MLAKRALKRKDAYERLMCGHVPILVCAPHDPSVEGTTGDGSPRILGEMIVRRDGSVDLRILASRVAAYGTTVLIAAALGAIIGP